VIFSLDKLCYHTKGCFVNAKVKRCMAAVRSAESLYVIKVP